MNKLMLRQMTGNIIKIKSKSGKVAVVILDKARSLKKVQYVTPEAAKMKKEFEWIVTGAKKESASVQFGFDTADVTDMDTSGGAFEANTISISKEF